MSAPTAAAMPVPDHVRTDRIVEFPFVRGLTTLAVPHDQVDLLPEGPDVVYVRSWPAPPGTWVIRKPELWRQLVLDNEHVTSAGGKIFTQITGGSWKMIPIEIDPPLHNKYRLILNPLVSPKAISVLDEKITGYARADVSAFKDRGNCEFMKEFAFEFPIRIFIELMGLPIERTAQFLAWERGMLYARSADEMKESVLAVVAYLRGEIAARRPNPRNDFIGHVLRAEIDGRKLDDDELLGILFTLFTGGLDTVSVHLAFIVRHLAENPDQQALLRSEPDQISNAIEELMRYYGTAGSTRTCAKDFEIDGVSIKAGERIMAFPLMSGRDAEEFPDPGAVRFDRNGRHLAFGFGPHVCIGMHLARRELRAAVTAMLDLLPPFRLTPGAEIVSEMSGMLQPRTLPLSWDVR